MSRKTRMTAWDWTHQSIEHITRTGYNVPDEELLSSEKHLRESLDRLYAMNLPMEAITEIAYVVENAYIIGRDRKK